MSDLKKSPEVVQEPHVIVELLTESARRQNHPEDAAQAGVIHAMYIAGYTKPYDIGISVITALNDAGFRIVRKRK